MFISKCDVCKKEIKKDRIDVRFSSFGSAEFCDKCGLPILKFLKKNKLIKEEKPKIKSN